MSLNRREMIRLGAVGAGGLLLSSAASSVSLPSIIYRAPVPAPAPEPLAPLAPEGVNAALFARAKAALDSHRASIRSRDVIGIADFSAASAQRRFHIVDLMSGTVESFQVAHGRGSDPDHSGYLERFSNDYGSFATSSGTYITGDHYDGKYGDSMKVIGLDASNNNAENRAIVIHNAWYAESEVAEAHGKLGRSEGCFAFGKHSQYQVMSRLGGGRMIYADKLA